MGHTLCLNTLSPHLKAATPSYCMWCRPIKDTHFFPLLMMTSRKFFLSEWNLNGYASKESMRTVPLENLMKIVVCTRPATTPLVRGRSMRSIDSKLSWYMLFPSIETLVHDVSSNNLGRPVIAQVAIISSPGTSMAYIRSKVISPCDVRRFSFARVRR